MKARLLLLLALIASLCLTLASCLIPTPPNTDDDPPKIEGDNFVWQDGSVLTVIAGTSYDKTRTNELFTSVTALQSAIVYTATTESEEAGHELVVGKCDRSISRLAYTELAKIEVGEYE